MSSIMVIITAECNYLTVTLSSLQLPTVLQLVMANQTTLHPETGHAILFISLIHLTFFVDPTPLPHPITTAFMKLEISRDHIPRAMTVNGERKEGRVVASLVIVYIKTSTELDE